MPEDHIDVAFDLAIFYFKVYYLIAWPHDKYPIIPINCTMQGVVGHNINRHISKAATTPYWAVDGGEPGNKARVVGPNIDRYIN